MTMALHVAQGNTWETQYNGNHIGMDGTADGMAEPMG